MNFRSLKNTFVSLLATRCDAREAENMLHIIIETLTEIAPRKRVDLQEWVIPNDLVIQVETIGRRVIGGEPLQYILGEEWFYGRRYTVSPAVLIPRGETEELVEWVLGHYAKTEQEIEILDIGTGSGCIAISLDLGIKYAKLTAMDCSKEALLIAQKNKEDLGADITLWEADILNMKDFPTGKWDCIVSNPPYIPEAESAEMAKHVVDYEPTIALFVPNHQPLLFYEKIADYALLTLKNQGQIFLEIHAPLGQAVADMLKSKGFSEVILRKDMHGRDRMVAAVSVISEQ